MGVLKRADGCAFSGVGAEMAGLGSRGGGKFAEATMQPFEVFRRPTFDPLREHVCSDETVRNHLGHLPVANQQPRTPFTWVDKR